MESRGGVRAWVPRRTLLLSSLGCPSSPVVAWAPEFRFVGKEEVHLVLWGRDALRD